jgi:pimeloyl-ACP methyl ester carboxylesterase
MVAWSLVSRSLGVLALVIVLLAAGAVLFLGVSASTPPLRDASGNAVPGSVAVLERVELGGLEQWITIRGADVANPVLLWLHGGPGSPQMPLAHHLDARLEQAFVVVHWDQRGAGKSNPAGFDESTMRFERYVDDALELIAYLRGRLGHERIALLGHSWGTQLGIELVAAHPELFDAYIGVSQVVDHDRATVIARDWLRSTIDPAKAPDDLRTLDAIEVPARRHGEYRALAQLVDAYGGSFDVPITRLAGIVARAPEYVVGDYPRLLRGMNRGGGPMHEGGVMANPDLVTTVPVLEVPAFFFSGARDYNTPLALVEAYAEVLEAPQVEVVVFEHAAHLPFLAEPERFVDEVIRVAGR